MSRAGRDNPSPFQPLRCRDITLLFLAAILGAVGALIIWLVTL